MSTTTRTSVIATFIVNEFHGGDTSLEIAPEEDLLGTGLVKSLEMMRLIEFIEVTFDLKVQPQDMTIENFITIQAMADYVDRAKVA